MKKFYSIWFAVLLLTLTLTGVGYAQETTGALQGTVKDATGAVVAGATVTVSTPTLVGTKTVQTDGKGYYHFSNLPSGSYLVKVEAKGFATLKREDLLIDVGHLPTVDLTLSAGSETTVVEVTSESPAIDVTTVTTQTNVTKDVIDYVPRGTSFQSVIQFAPAASNEPLMGNTMTNGTGSTSPGNGSNGNPYGYSVAGGSDSENSYLVEGQETANLIGGYSHTNVPFDFIDQVQIKTSGIEAEHGGALGGVVNVIMKKGTSHLHGSVFSQFEDQALDATASSYIRYNPLTSQTVQATWVSAERPTCPQDTGIACYTGHSDALVQSYQPIKSHNSDVFPGFTLGGPLSDLLPKMVPISSKWDDRLFFFVGFNPELNRFEETINYGAGNGGKIPFSQNTNTFYSTARIDAQVTSKIRVFASWLYQFQHQNGEALPTADSTQGYYNAAASNDPSTYAHTLGYSAPNTTFNTGADITITQNLVATTRFGYYFENYHDFGYPTGGVIHEFYTSGVAPAKDGNGNPLPSSLAQPIGTIDGALNQLTAYNSNKAVQLDQTLAFYKSGWFGTHNFKFGYQLNRLSNVISQSYNEPFVQLYVGDGGDAAYSSGGPVGDANCAKVEAMDNTGSNCQGKYGYAVLYDYGTGGNVISYNHSLFAQDSWTVGRGLTFDLGLRIEKEFLPGEVQGPGVPVHPIAFSWGDKIAPRLGAAWDVFQNGKMKVFGSYGVFNDQMKLNVAISSFGGAYWNNCAYALDTSDVGSIDAAFDSNRRFCSGLSSSSPGNFAGGVTPPGLTFLENINNRAATPTCTTCNPYLEGVAPNLKPYRQHEAVGGVDYQVSRNLSFEARYDRRRLDHVIEDAAIYDPGVGETFVIINPGQGVDTTFNGFCAFLYSQVVGNTGCTSSTGAYPPNQSIAAARSYDGLEFRLNKAISNHWAGLFSYTYSHFRGNYTGLTSSDISDGGTGGRNAPNNSRAFDEPYFQSNSFGGSSSGLLPTDRPNKLKGYAYYRLEYLHKVTTDFGIFQTLYQGSPNTSYMSVGYDQNAYFQNVFDRGKWANVSQNPTTGAITVGAPYTYRNPWYDQTDLNLTQSFKVSENKSLSFGATFSNLLNQHTVTAVNEQIDSPNGGGSYYARPGGYYIANGVAFYAASLDPYSVSGVLNDTGGTFLNNVHGPETISGEYGKPLSYQTPRHIRLQFNFSF